MILQNMMLDYQWSVLMHFKTFQTESSTNRVHTPTNQTWTCFVSFEWNEKTQKRQQKQGNNLSKGVRLHLNYSDARRATSDYPTSAIMAGGGERATATAYSIHLRCRCCRRSRRQDLDFVAVMQKVKISSGTVGTAKKVWQHTWILHLCVRTRFKFICGD